MRFRRNRKKIGPFADLTPLITVVLQLVFFFMLSTSFVAHTSIPIEVPEASGTPRFDEKALSVTLQYGEGGPDGQGPVYIDGEAISDWGQLATRLAELSHGRPGAMVLVRPDQRVPTGRTIRVLGLLDNAGIRRYSIEAQAPKESP